VPVRIYQSDEEEMHLVSAKAQLKIFDATSVSGIDQISSLRVYPNPSNSNFTLEISSPLSGEHAFTIQDQLGRVVAVASIDLPEGTQFVGSQQLLQKPLAAGSYVVVVKNADKEMRVKLIIQ
jgi:hypothetical protein